MFDRVLSTLTSSLTHPKSLLKGVSAAVVVYVLGPVSSQNHIYLRDDNESELLSHLRSTYSSSEHLISLQIMLIYPQATVNCSNPCKSVLHFVMLPALTRRQIADIQTNNLSSTFHVSQNPPEISFLTSSLPQRATCTTAFNHLLYL